jgi:hypothetical protein
MFSTILCVLLLVAFLWRRPPATECAYVVAVLGLAAISPIVALSPRVALRGFPLLARTGARLSRRWFLLAFGLSCVMLVTVTVLAVGNSRTPFTP